MHKSLRITGDTTGLNKGRKRSSIKPLSQVVIFPPHTLVISESLYALCYPNSHIRSSVGTSNSFSLVLLIACTIIRYLHGLWLSMHHSPLDHSLFPGITLCMHMPLCMSSLICPMHSKISLTFNSVAYCIYIPLMIFSYSNYILCDKQACILQLAL